MTRYKVTDNETGRKITFQWHLDTPPTEKDMTDVFAEAKQVKIPSIPPSDPTVPFAELPPTERVELPRAVTGEPFRFEPERFKERPLREILEPKKEPSPYVEATIKTAKDLIEPFIKFPKAMRSPEVARQIKEKWIGKGTAGDYDYQPGLLQIGALAGLFTMYAVEGVRMLPFIKDYISQPFKYQTIKVNLATSPELRNKIATGVITNDVRLFVEKWGARPGGQNFIKVVVPRGTSAQQYMSNLVASTKVTPISGMPSGVVRDVISKTSNFAIPQVTPKVVTELEKALISRIPTAIAKLPIVKPPVKIVPPTKVPTKPLAEILKPKVGRPKVSPKTAKFYPAETQKVFLSAEKMTPEIRAEAKKIAPRVSRWFREEAKRKGKKPTEIKLFLQPEDIFVTAREALGKPLSDKYAMEMLRETQRGVEKAGAEELARVGRYAKPKELEKLSAEDIKGLGEIFRLPREVQVTTVQGKKVTLPKGEEYRVQIVKSGNVRLTDGKQVTVETSELKKFKGMQLGVGEMKAGGIAHKAKKLQQKVQEEVVIPREKRKAEIVKKIIPALKKVGKVYKQRWGVYQKSRAGRLARAGEVAGKKEGARTLKQMLGIMKGSAKESEKITTDILRKAVSDDDIDFLFDEIVSHYEKTIGNVAYRGSKIITAHTALKEGLEGKPLPPAQRAALSEALSPDVAKAIIDSRSLLKKIYDVGLSIVNFPKAVKASFDDSFVGRQGLMFVTRHPIRAWNGWKKHWKAVTVKGAEQIEEFIDKWEYREIADKAGLGITKWRGGEMAEREEPFLSKLAEKTPGIALSNRLYTSNANLARVLWFDTIAKRMELVGKDFKQNPELAKAFAELVNSATGRGDIGALQKIAPILNAFFWSPKFVKGAVDMLNPAKYVLDSPKVRVERLKTLGAFIGIGFSVLFLVNLIRQRMGKIEAGNWKIGMDDTSTDFGKIIYKGRTRIDIWGGKQQFVVLFCRLMRGKMTSSVTGKEMELGKGYKATTRKDILQRFGEYKIAPAGSFALKLLEGKGFAGKPIDIPKEVGNMFVPMAMEDMYTTVKEHGAKGIPMGTAALFGIGVQTYGIEKQIEKRTKGKKKLKDFFQKEKRGVKRGKQKFSQREKR